MAPGSTPRASPSPPIWLTLHSRTGDVAVFVDEKGQQINGQWTGSPTPNEHRHHDRFGGGRDARLLDSRVATGHRQRRRRGGRSVTPSGHRAAWRQHGWGASPPWNSGAFEHKLRQHRARWRRRPHLPLRALTLDVSASTEDPWPFDQAANVAAITTVNVIERGAPDTRCRSL